VPDLKGKKTYTDAEIVVLTAIFAQSDFSAGDDEKDECKRIASELGRSNGSIDRQWRNIKDYLNGTATKKVGSKIKYWAECLLGDPAAIVALADYYCNRHVWDLLDLVHGRYGEKIG
jgi:hypothetical protein